jgi:tetratricopeptide (TPR) repeat protein
MDPLPSLVGRYQIRERLGHGGMGTLYLALDPTIERLVALKILRVNDVEVRERFLREARLVARLQNPNIITIYDVGSHDGQPFIAMEYVAGDTVDMLVKRRAPLSVERKIALMIELCDALAHAHRAGIVHRDIKPSNLIVQRESGLLKVLDFGIARTVDSSLTQAGSIMGTPNYMAPEQVEGLVVDQRSDIFAVGAVCYEFLTLRQAFSGDTPFLVLQRIVHGAPEPVSQIDPTLNPALQDILDRALAKDPAARYQDLSEMRSDLMGMLRQSHAGTEDRTLIVAPAAERVRRGVDLARLVEERAAQLAEHLREVETALSIGEMDRAVAAAEEAALLDPDDPRVASALDRARRACDARDVAQWLAEARTHFERGALTDAARLVTHALQVDPQSHDVRVFQLDVERAIDERERRRERDAAVQRALAHASAAEAAGDLESARRAAREALGYDPSSAEALEVRRRIELKLATEPTPKEPDREDAPVVAAKAPPPPVADVAQAEAESPEPPDPERPITVVPEASPPAAFPVPFPLPSPASARPRWLASRMRAAAAALLLMLILVPSLWWLQSAPSVKPARVTRPPVRPAPAGPPRPAPEPAPTPSIEPATGSARDIAESSQTRAEPAASSSVSLGALRAPRTAMRPPNETTQRERGSRNPPHSGPTANTPASPAASPAFRANRAAGPIEDKTLIPSVNATRRLLTRGRRSDALESLAALMARARGHAQVTSLAGDVVEGARRDALRARERAVSAGARSKASGAFARAEANLGAASRRGASAPIDAARRYWWAESLFASAADFATRPAAVTTAPSAAPPTERAVTAPPADLSTASRIEPPPAPSKPPDSLPAPGSPTTGPVARNTAASVATPPVPSAAPGVAVRQTLDRWASAYGSRRVGEVTRVWPTMTSDQARRLGEAFKSISRYAVSLRGCEVSEQGERASASCHVRRTIQFQDGRAGEFPARVTFRLERRGAQWVIVAVSGA